MVPPYWDSNKGSPMDTETEWLRHKALTLKKMPTWRGPCKRLWNCMPSTGHSRHDHLLEGMCQMQGWQGWVQCMHVQAGGPPCSWVHPARVKPSVLVMVGPLPASLPCVKKAGRLDSMLAAVVLFHTCGWPIGESEKLG